mmetsp:Transcript_12869/g.13907  ORF Transcript_12869/g.13907 Transcript_12869/m.13907 type:complete len:334 (-) Transcript_12869:54-1055(-)
MSNHQNLSACHFIDHLAYLRDDTVWVESRAARLESEEKAALIKFVHDLHDMNTENFDKRFLKASGNNYLGEDYFKRLQDRKRREFVRNVFIAAAIRQKILREEKSENMAVKNYLYDFFLRNEALTDEEKTLLHRYALALWILSDIYQNEGKKTLMMGVATHLQGSDVYIEYTTGGKNTPATARRVRLHEEIAGYSPRQRPPRDGNKQRSSDVIVKRGRGRPRKNTLSHPIPMLHDDEMVLSFEEFEDSTAGDSSSFIDSLDEDDFNEDESSAITFEDEDTTIQIYHDYHAHQLVTFKVEDTTIDAAMWEFLESLNKDEDALIDASMWEHIDNK